MLLLRNLSMTLRSGVSIFRALSFFAEEATGSRKTLIEHLAKSIEAGHTLADAMVSAPRKFPEIAINLVRSGEASGNLPDSLATIAKHLQKKQNLIRKIRSAMMYPTFVLIAILGLGLSIGTLVLPELIPLFDSLDVTLPLSTRMLLVIAEFFSNYGVLIIIAVSLCLFCFYILTRLEAVKPYWHGFLLRIPYIGALQRRAAVAQVTETLATMLHSGISISDAIPAAAKSTENRVFRQAVVSTLSIVESGHTFAEGLRQAGSNIPGLTMTLVDVGEETGTLVESLEYLSEYYEAEVDYAVKELTTALEPLLLIFIGLIVGGTVLAIITPIYDVTGSIR